MNSDDKNLKIFTLNCWYVLTEIYFNFNLILLKMKINFIIE